MNQVLHTLHKGLPGNSNYISNVDQIQLLKTTSAENKVVIFREKKINNESYLNASEVSYYQVQIDPNIHQGREEEPAPQTIEKFWLKRKPSETCLAHSSKLVHKQ